MYVTLATGHQTAALGEEVENLGAPIPMAQLKAGAHLFYEGDEVVWLYQVMSGVLRMTRLLEDGRRQVIAFGYPGDIVGFPANGRHHTDCDAIADARLQPYRHSSLENGDGDIELHGHLLNAALREISEMQDHFMMLGRKSAAEKVASFLSALIKRVGEDHDGICKFGLPMRRADIADFLGLTTETVSRTLTQMRKDGIIEIEDFHTVFVRRPDALIALSQGTDAD